METQKLDTPKLVTLLRELVEATRQGRVKWSETETGGKYRVSLGMADLEIEREKYWKDSTALLGVGGSQYSYVTYLFRPMGDKVIDVEFFNPQDSHYSVAKAAYDLAHKQVNNVDQLLDAMISEVQKRTNS